VIGDVRALKVGYRTGKDTSNVQRYVAHTDDGDALTG
jgi:hypothetical protein